MEILNILLFTFYFFAPAGVANVAAFFSSKIPLVRQFSLPVDLYAKYNGKRVLGDHKTIRGFIVGILGSILIVYLQIWLYNQSSWIREVVYLDYNTINPLLFGFLSGFGALAGDAIKSFFKRQRNIKPGESWVPFDQIDYILGGIACTALYIRLTPPEYLVLFVLWFLVHPLTTVIGYVLRLKEKPL